MPHPHVSGPDNATGDGAPPKKPRTALWITVGILAALIVGLVITAPFIMKQVNHASALREYQTASEELDAANAALTTAMQQASLQAEEAAELRDATNRDRVDDPDLIDAVTTALNDLEPLTTAAEGTEAPSESPMPGTQDGQIPAETEQLRLATTGLLGEAESVHERAQAVATATTSLRGHSLAVLDSLSTRGQAYAAESSKRAGTAEQTEFEAALEELSAQHLNEGSDLVALVSQLDSTWDAVAASMAPVYEDISGYWCGWFKTVDCISIELPMTEDSTRQGTLAFSHEEGGCFMASWSPYPETGRRGGMGYGFCPADIPEPASWFRAQTAAEIGSDESRDRMFSFGSSGGAYQVYFREN